MGVRRPADAPVAPPMADGGAGGGAAGGAVRPPELPALLLKRLELRVLRRLDGFLFGEHAGPFHGPSLDLAEVREYQPGDEVRRIDWPVTARTGALHVRLYREEREVGAWLLVDGSPSMAFGTRRALKRDAALEFAAVAAIALLRAGNKVGGLGFAPGGCGRAPLGGGRRQALALLRALQAPLRTNGAPRSHRENDPSAPRELAGALALLDRTVRRRALVLALSDFPLGEGELQAPAEPRWAPALRRLARRHDVIAVRVRDPAERRLPDAGELRLRDPETGAEAWVDTSDPRVRRAHAAFVARRDAAFERLVRSARVDAWELSTDADPVAAAAGLARRRRERRR